MCVCSFIDATDPVSSSDKVPPQTQLEEEEEPPCESCSAPEQFSQSVSGLLDVPPPSVCHLNSYSSSSKTSSGERKGRMKELQLPSLPTVSVWWIWKIRNGLLLYFCFRNCAPESPSPHPHSVHVHCHLLWVMKLCVCVCVCFREIERDISVWVVH